jgi:hypothetical protein
MLTNMPFALPDWMPGWMFLLLAVPVLLYLLMFLLMPFSVFGVKSRIESLEAQIEALQDDLRMMSMRAAGVLPRAATSLDSYDDVPNFGHLKKSQREYTEPVVTPATPRGPAPAPAMRPAPAPVAPVRELRERLTPSPAPRNGRRAEPRLD